jgi:predicted kinase
MKLILVNGSTCAGKSTLVKAVLKQRERLYYLSYDALKWGFSQYNPKVHGGDVVTVMSAVAECVFSLKYNIICDSVMIREHREHLMTLAKKHDYEIVEINIEASYDVLLKRFDERVARAKADPTIRISNLSQDRFRELYEIYEAGKNPEAPTIRTDEQSVDENIASLLKMIS